MSSPSFGKSYLHIKNITKIKEFQVLLQIIRHINYGIAGGFCPLCTENFSLLEEITTLSPGFSSFVIICVLVSSAIPSSILHLFNPAFVKTQTPCCSYFLVSPFGENLRALFGTHKAFSIFLVIIETFALIPGIAKPSELSTEINSLALNIENNQNEQQKIVEMLDNVKKMLLDKEFELKNMQDSINNGVQYAKYQQKIVNEEKQQVADESE